MQVKRLFAGLLLSLTLNLAWAAGCAGTGVCFWIGGSANTSGATTHWATTSGGATTGSVPTAADDCRFDANSNATAYTVTVNGTLACKDLSFLAAPSSSGTVTFAGSSAVSIAGNEALLAGMSSTYTGTKTYTRTSSGGTITSAGVSRAENDILSGVSGVWTYQDAFVTTGSLTLTNGDLEANNNAFTVGSFSSANSNIRVLTLGSNTWTVTGSGSNVWNTSTITNLTLNSGGTISLTYAGATATSFNGGGANYGSTNLNFTAGTYSAAISVAGNTFKNLSFAGFTGDLAAGNPYNLNGNLTLGTGMTVTTDSGNGPIFTGSTTQTITSNGVTMNRPINVSGASTSVVLADALNLGTRGLTVTQGTFSDAGMSITAASFLSSNANTRVIAKTGDWLLTGTGQVFSTSTTTGLTYSDSGLISCTNATASARTFTSNSAVTLNNVSVAAGTGDFNLTGSPNIRNLNFSGFTGALLGSNSPSLTGNLTYGAGMTSSATGVWLFVGNSGTQSITSNAVAFGKGITVVTTGSTVSLADDLNLGTGRARFDAGTFTANNKNLTATFYLLGQAATARTVTMGSGTWLATSINGSGLTWEMTTSTGLTLNANTSTIKLTDSTASDKTFQGAGFTYNNFWFSGTGAGAFLVNGSNTFADIKIDQDLLVTPAAGTTQTVSTFSPQGVAGHTVTLASQTPGTQYTLIKTGARVSTDYMNVTDMIGGYGYKWFMGKHSVNGGNNKGVAFTTPGGAAN